MISFEIFCPNKKRETKMNEKKFFLIASFSGTREQIEKALNDENVRKDLLELLTSEMKHPNYIQDTKDDCVHEADLFKNEPKPIEYMAEYNRRMLDSYFRCTNLCTVYNDRKRALVDVDFG